MTTKPPSTVEQWHKATILEFYQIFWSHWYSSSGKHIYREKTKYIYKDLKLSDPTGTPVKGNIFTSEN